MRRASVRQGRTGSPPAHRGTTVMEENGRSMPKPAPGRLSDDALSALVERSDRKGLAHLALHTVLAIAAAGVDLRERIRDRVDAPGCMALRHHPRLPLRTAARDRALHRLSKPLGQSRGVGGVRMDSRAPAALLPRVPPGASPVHAGSGARPRARRRASADLVRLSVAGERFRVLDVPGLERHWCTWPDGCRSRTSRHRSGPG